MNYRSLGNTGITVSEIGFGAWGVGGKTDGATSYGETDDTVSLRALDAALEAGITFYDTSNLYGAGHSEELIGQAFYAKRDQVVIGSKAGQTGYETPSDFSASGIRSSVEGSLKRLRTDYLDVVLLHNPSPQDLERSAEIAACLQALKSDGLVRAVGASVKTPAEGKHAIESLGAEVLQVNFNMLDPRVLEQDLFTVTQRDGVAIVARTPLAFGFLSGAVDENTQFAPDDHRSNWNRDQIIRWSRDTAKIFTAIDRPEDQTQSDVALRYCLSFPEVSTVIPGILTPEEARANARASDLPRLSQDEIDAVLAISSTQPIARPKRNFI